jgi:SM-20-related protein
MLENIFNSLIDRFIATRLGIAENFLSATLCLQLKENLRTLHAGHQLKSAGVGETDEVAYNKLIRGDMIYWLDRKHEDIYENAFFDIMDAFVQYLNETCYTGIRSYEFHYTLYEKGSFYKKHIDQFRHNDSRKYSMIMYLNDNWQLSDGGELCIYQPNGIQTISPNSGKSVFFQSNELAHEVLVTHVPRLSITGWLKS